MNLLATVGFPAVCIVLPLIGLKDGWYNSKHWGFYLLPQKELILIPVLAQLTSWIDDFYGIFDLQTNAWVRATEFKELFWGVTLVCYGIILKKRLSLLKQTQEKAETGPLVQPRMAASA